MRASFRRLGGCAWDRLETIIGNPFRHDHEGIHMARPRSILRPSSSVLRLLSSGMLSLLLLTSAPPASAIPICNERSCADGLDDDGDGLVDCADFDCCYSPADCGFHCIEENCFDGVDDDLDGLVDLADPNCCERFGSPFECQEVTCDDGVDNDGDGLIDCEEECCMGAAPCCRPACTEIDCDDGGDDDGDLVIDCADPDCCFECYGDVYHLASLLPTRPGYAVMTMALERADQPVVLLLDIRCPEANAPGVGVNWPAPRDIHQDVPSETWTLANIGTPVFGIAVDRAPAPNIYLSSTPLMIDLPAYPTNGDVVRICGATGRPCLIAELPNQLIAPPEPFGPGLGNLAHDAVHEQLFVTNFEDGRIYRIPLAGLEDCSLPGADCPDPMRGPFDAYDPFGADDGLPGMPPHGERLWAVAVHCGRVYFGRWRDTGHEAGVPTGEENEIWSVGILPTGEFDRAGGERLELVHPTCDGGGAPPSDIEFSEDGSMLVAERTMSGGLGAHASRLLEFAPAPPSWSPGQLIPIGAYSGVDNSAGGCDYARCAPADPRCPAAPRILASGDTLTWPDASAPCDRGAIIYGLQVTPAIGGHAGNSYLVDADGTPCSSIKKSRLGDVDYLRDWRDCEAPCGAADCCTQNLAPPAFLDAPSDVAVECGDAPPPAILHAESACSPAFEATYLGQDPPVPPDDCPYALTRTWSAIDSCGREARWTQVITVADTLPPRLVSAAAFDCLWPPNHRYACFGRDDFAIEIVDDCDPAPTWRFAGCASDQCDEAPCPEHPGENGDGNTVNDCVIDGDRLCVRSERAGTEPEGRTYGIDILITDACGNESLARIASIYVPHDQSPHEDCRRPDPPPRRRSRR